MSTFKTRHELALKNGHVDSLGLTVLEKAW